MDPPPQFFKIFIYLAAQSLSCAMQYLLVEVTRPPWVALHDMAHSFIELDKAVVHVIRLVFCDCSFQSVCTLMEKYKRLMEAS